MLFVVAGYPGSGKTTALSLAAFKGAQLFPKPFDQRFSACLPEQFMSERSPTREKLAARMWLTCGDEAEFSAIEHKPQDAVHHLDLLMRLMMDVRVRSWDDLDDAAIRRSFEDFFARPIAGAYAERCVVTLYPDFALIRHRWTARMAKYAEAASDQARLKHRLIFGVHSPDLYRRVMRIWYDVAVEACEHVWLMRGGSRGDGLPYRQVALL
jgi:hypothetical protein